MKRVVSVIALLLVAAISVGCGTTKTNQGSAPPASGQTGATGGGTSAAPGVSAPIEVKSDDGSEQIGAALPEGYPSNLLPVMKGANVVNAAKVEDSHKVTFETKATLDEAAQFYDKALNSGTDYQMIDDRAGSGSINMMAVKESWQLAVTISPQGSNGLTLVELDISPN